MRLGLPRTRGSPAAPRRTQNTADRQRGLWSENRVHVSDDENRHTASVCLAGVRSSCRRLHRDARTPLILLPAHGPPRSTLRSLSRSRVPHARSSEYLISSTREPWPPHSDVQNDSPECQRYWYVLAIHTLSWEGRQGRGRVFEAKEEGDLTPPNALFQKVTTVQFICTDAIHSGCSQRYAVYSGKANQDETPQQVTNPLRGLLIFAFVAVFGRFFSYAASSPGLTEKLCVPAGK